MVSSPESRTKLTPKRHQPQTPSSHPLLPDRRWKLLAAYIRINPALSDTGWVVYGKWNGAVFALSGSGVNVAQASANATWNPFVAFAQNLTGEGVQVQGATTVPFNLWYEWYKNQPVYPGGLRNWGLGC